MYTDKAFGANLNLLVSRRNPPFVGWVAIDEFENLFSTLDNSHIAVVTNRPFLPDPLGRVRDRFLGPFASLKDFEEQGELLLVVARAPSDLRMLYSVKHARKRFRNIAGYVIDSYFVEGFPAATKNYDHIFSTTQEGAVEVRTRFGIPSSVLRQGIDCLTWACVSGDRSIDLIGFGRQPPSYHKQFQHAFHTPRSALIYLHSPIGATEGDDVWIERPMMLKLLQRSKMSLAFHLLVEPQFARPRAASFVTSRWFESLASGCVVLGKRPPGQMAEEMFCWQNALIELSNDPKESTAMIAAFASDANFLEATRVRNVIEMCRLHDWRYRIRDVYEHFNLKQPLALKDSLVSLDRLIQKLKLDAGTE
jgi:hypothetical protein